MMTKTQREEFLRQALDLPEDKLRGEFVAALSGAEAGIERACLALKVMADRGMPLPSRLPAAFAHFREIADGALSAHAAWTAGGVPGAVKHLLRLDPADQDRVADGLKVKVAARWQGRMSSQDLTIFEMSQAQMDLAFSEEKGFRPLEDQQKIMWARQQPVAAAPVKPKLKASPKTGEIIVGRTPVLLADLAEVLASMGYMLKSIPKPKAPAAEKMAAE